MLSRRRFIGQVSAATAYAWTNKANAEVPGSLSSTHPNPTSPGTEAAPWTSYGRIVLQHLQNSVIVQDGFTIEQRTYGDCDFSFEGRAPLEAPEVQIWSGIKCRDRDSRYVFALRGGNNDHLYLARYGADGAAKFLGIAPLDFHPVPGDWYTLRTVTRGNRFLIFVNGETTPRINVVDDEAPWAEGGVSLGGGWLPAEFRNVKANALSAADASSIYDLGDAVWQAPKPDKSQLRAKQRQAYLPADLPPLDQPRVTCPLDGNWLFLPDQELVPSIVPQAEALDDAQWHVMDVPNFWTPPCPGCTMRRASLNSRGSPPRKASATNTGKRRWTASMDTPSIGGQPRVDGIGTISISPTPSPTVALSSALTPWPRLRICG